jgi:hypothetical protein
MVIFHPDDYYSTLDRNFYHKEEASGKTSEVDFPDIPSEGTELTPREVGVGLDANVYPMTGLNAKIREGAAKVEITFMGAGKGHAQSITPESIGKLEREQLREMSKLNEVKFTTHSTPNMMGVSGYNPQARRFDDRQQQQQLEEINKAIEFAAEASTGGAIVFHTGEWNRPIIEAGLSPEERAKGKTSGFKAFGTEPQKAVVSLVDSETGEITGISKEQKFYFPEESYDQKLGMSLVKTNPDGTPIVHEYKYNDAVDYLKKLHANDGMLLDKRTGKMKSDEQIILMGYYDQKVREQKGQMFRFTHELEEGQKQLRKIVHAKEFVKELAKTIPKENQDVLMEYIPSRIPYVPSDKKTALEILEDAERQYRNQIEYSQSIVTAAQESIQNIEKVQERMKPIEEVGIERTTKAIAELGMKAMDATKKHRKDIDEPLFISPESFEPDYYGSHPVEIRKIISESRNNMAKMLEEKGFSSAEAKEKAKTHIRATLDSGHFNMWRKHFQGKPEDYEKWYLEETEKLAKEGIVGHIHLTDNFGYDDEHLTPGQGNVPIREFVKRMEKAGVRDFIVERGSFNGTTALPDTLAEIGSPIYALNKGRRFTFGNMNRGHFGYSAPPNYMVGAYVPSNEWRFWSEVPLE